MTQTRKRRAPSLSRYEPLSAPEKWSADEKRFAVRLSQLLDELYEKNAVLQKRVTALETLFKEE